MKGWNDCCLAVEGKEKPEIVAIGRVYIPEEVEVVRLGGVLLPDDHRQVDVIEDIVPTAPLPYEYEEMQYVCQAKISYVAWPSHLIFPKNMVCYL